MNYFKPEGIGLENNVEHNEDHEIVKHLSDMKVEWRKTATDDEQDEEYERTRKFLKHLQKTYPHHLDYRLYHELAGSNNIETKRPGFNFILDFPAPEDSVIAFYENNYSPKDEEEL